MIWIELIQTGIVMVAAAIAVRVFASVIANVFASVFANVFAKVVAKVFAKIVAKILGVRIMLVSVHHRVVVAHYRFRLCSQM